MYSQSGWFLRGTQLQSNCREKTVKEINTGALVARLPEYGGSSGSGTASNQLCV